MRRLLLTYWWFLHLNLKKGNETYNRKEKKISHFRFASFEPLLTLPEPGKYLCSMFVYTIVGEFQDCTQSLLFSFDHSSCLLGFNFVSGTFFPFCMSTNFLQLTIVSHFQLPAIQWQNFNICCSLFECSWAEVMHRRQRLAILFYVCNNKTNK